MPRRLTTYEFIQRAKKVHGEKYDYSLTSYMGKSKKIIIICNEHGEFTQEPRSHTTIGNGCPKCAGNKKMNRIEFIEKANIMHRFKYTYKNSVYINNVTDILITCRKHGDFSQRPSHHLQGRGCRKCQAEQHGPKTTLSTRKFIEQSNIIHNNFYDYSSTIYTGSRNKVKIICPYHGEFIQYANGHKQGNGCGKCKKKKQYNLFYKIKNKFKKEDIEWEARPKWLKGQELDIYFPDYNIGIEYQGEQHYFPVSKYPTNGDNGYMAHLKTIKYDKLKRKKCINNSCYLFEVKYNYTSNDFLKMVASIKIIIKKQTHKNKKVKC